MSIQNPFINKPPETLADLHDAMKSTHPDIEQFSTFKHWIIFYHPSLDLISSSYTDQPHDKWLDFVDKIAALEPQLKLYTECWPVSVYYDFYSRRRIRREGYLKDKMVTAEPDIVTNRQETAMKDVVVHHNEPLHGERPSNEKQSCIICKACQMLKTNKLVDVCKAGYLLVDFLKIGIAFDHHLEALLALPDKQRRQFIASIPSEKMNAVHKYRILKVLEPMTKDNLMIPVTGSAARTLIHSHYPEFQNLLRSAMGLDQYPDIFGHILDQMEIWSVGYFKKPCPSITQYSHTANLLWRALEPYNLHMKYKHFWPIRIYLSQKASTLSTRPQFTEQDQDRVCSDLYLKQLAVESGHGLTSSSRVPPTLEEVPFYSHTCPELRGVSENLHKHMQQVGLSALLPGLALMGLKTVHDFEEFCACSETERLAIVNLSEISLSDFEFFALGLGLEVLMQHTKR